MKPLFLLLLVLCGAAGFAQQLHFKNLQNPISIHTANAEDYLTNEEKLVFAYLNLARTQPVYFADSVLKTYPGAPRLDNSYLKTSPYVTSLYDHLKTMKPLPPLRPSKSLYTSAKCFAEFTGKTGRVGHDRKGTDCTFEQAECCSYGLSSALDIAMQLLIDKDVASLGHRKICLGPYSTMGLSIQPHKEYRYTAVLQFK
jgi:hypothetical protein